MRIVKRIKDYGLSESQAEFADFLEKNSTGSVCYEKILNPDFISEYIRPKHGFVIYTNAQNCAGARRFY